MTETLFEAGFVESDAAFDNPEEAILPEPTGDGVTSISGKAEREQWLYEVADALFPKFSELGYRNHPTIRIGVG